MDITRNFHLAAVEFRINWRGTKLVSSMQKFQGQGKIVVIPLRKTANFCHEKCSKNMTKVKFWSTVDRGKFLFFSKADNLTMASSI